MVAFWMRRDLRLADNAALYHALRSGKKVVPVFIFDTEILSALPKDDKRVLFIHQTLATLQTELRALGSTLVVKYGKPSEVWESLAKTYALAAIYTNHDYEPYATERDAAISALMHTRGIAFHTYKDQVIFEKNEVLSQTGTPYTVFTPYSKKWKSLLNDFYLQPYPTEKYFAAFFSSPALPMPSLVEMGFEAADYDFPPLTIDIARIKPYHDTRDFPAQKGTTRLGLHLRFGTISIRKLATIALANNETYLNELIWREFYMQILWHFPHVVTRAFKPAYDRIKWQNDTVLFEKWCAGKTGYALVDAGMRELNATGYMHNRVRMLVASFLTKHLLIDWRWGEAYFEQKLLDFELASNNGGWQWAAGCGCDAAPYFRIFSPDAQVAKFDKSFAYVRKWVPEYGTYLYPKPIVNHAFARERVLEVYKSALASDAEVMGG